MGYISGIRRPGCGDVRTGASHDGTGSDSAPQPFLRRWNHLPHLGHPGVYPTYLRDGGNARRSRGAQRHVYAHARDRKDPDARSGFLRHVFPKEIYGHKSAWIDYKFFLIDKITFPLVFAPLILGFYLVHRGTGELLGRIWGADGPGFASGPAEPCISWTERIRPVKWEDNGIVHLPKKQRISPRCELRNRPQQWAGTLTEMVGKSPRIFDLE